MNLVSILLIFIPALVFLIWTLRFKTSLILIATVPLVVLVAGVIALNSDPSITFEVSDRDCASILHSSNSTTSGNQTTTTYNSTLECDEAITPVNYLIMAEALTLLNYATMLAVLSVAFYILWRAVSK